VTGTTANPRTPHLFAADEPELVRAPGTTYVATVGSGRPGTADFYRRKELVAAIVRALPAQLRVADADGVVEVLYRYPVGSVPVDIADFYTVNPIDDLQYTVVAQVGAGTSEDDVRTAALTVPAARNEDVSLVALPERLVVQILHHGPFADEYATLDRLGEFAAARGLSRAGDHHEVHLDPFSATSRQDRLRTILRDPVA
jgi:hypothetical protein